MEKACRKGLPNAPALILHSESHSPHRVVMGDVCSGASNVCWLSPASRCYSKCIEAVQLIRDSDCVSVFQCRPKRSWLEDFVARWLTDVSPFAHAFAAMISSEFTGLETTVDATGSPMFFSVCICIQVLSLESIYTCRSCAWTLWHNHIISTLQVVNPFHTILCNAGFDSLTVDGSVQSSEVTWDLMDGNRHVLSNRSYHVLIVVSTEPLQHYIPNWPYDAKPLIC